MKIPKWIGLLAVFWIFIFSVFCIFVPLFSLFSELTQTSALSLLFDPTILSVAVLTLKQSLLSTVISGVLGLLLGLWAGETVSTAKNDARIQTLFSIPFGISTLVAAMAWITWLGRSGVLAQMGFPLDWAYSLKAVLLAHAFLNIPLAALMVYQARKQIPETQFEAARTLGAPWLHQLRWIIWPQIRWPFWASCAQIMNLCTMSFILVLILGGGPPVQTLETELYERLRYGLLDLSGATACAFWEIILSLVPWILVLFFRGKSSQRLAKRSWSHSIRSNRLLLGVGAFFFFPYLIVLNPIAVKKLVFQHDLLISLLEPLRISFTLAVATATATIVTSIFAVLSLQYFKQIKWKLAQKGFSILFGLPSGISILVLGLGVWTAYQRWLDPFDGSFAAIVLLQMTLFFPLAFRILWPATERVLLRQMESAVLMGASEWRAFWIIEWPQWKGPLLSSFSGILGASLGEVGAVSLFYSEKLIPLPLLVSRWMGQYRFEEAQAVSALILILSIGLIGTAMATIPAESGNNLKDL